MSAVINETDQLVQFLKNVKLFAELSPDSLGKLGTCLKTAEFPPAEVMVREGAPGVSMYIIKSGMVEVRKKDPTTGIDFLVAQLGEGEQRSLVDSMRQNKIDGWQGPPGSFVYLLLRSDAVDVVYGTMEGYAALGIPYQAHIVPEKRW